MAPGARELEQRVDASAAPRRPPARPARRAPSRRRRRSRSRASSRATWPVTAVLPTRLPGADHGERRQRERLEARAGRSGSRRRRTGARARATRLASANRSRGPSTGSSERSTTTSGACSAIAASSVVDERHAVVLAAAQLLRAADEDARDELVRQLGERVAHDGGVVLAVDRPRRALTCASSPRPRSAPVYFSNSSVSVENWMIRSCPWNGYRRQTSTCAPVDLDHVVTGPRVPAQAQRRDRAGVDDEQVLEPPRVRHVLVAGEDEVDAGALQALDRVAGVVDDVALAARARDRQQVVVQDEDLQVGRLARTAPRSSGSGRGRSGRGRGRARSSRPRRP